MIGENLDQLVDYGRKAGWDFIDGIADAGDARIRDQLRQAEKDDADRKTVEAAFKAFHASPEGRKALQYLCDRTINRPVFLTHLGLSAEQVAIYGAHREGANQLMWQILKLIATGEPDDKQPAPREAP